MTGELVGGDHPERDIVFAVALDPPRRALTIAMIVVLLELLRAGVPLNVIQCQLGHRHLGVTSIYLQGIDPDEIIQTVHARRPPMIPASVGLALPRRR